MIGYLFGQQTHRMNGNDLTGVGNSVYASVVGINYNAVPNRPIDNCDVVTYANYWNGVVQNSNYPQSDPTGYLPLTTAADNYASGNPTQMATALLWVDKDLQGTNGDAIPAGTTNISLASLSTTGGTNLGSFNQWETIVAAYHTARAGFTPALAPITVECYEGGQNILAPTTAQCTTIGISTSYGTTSSGSSGGTIYTLLEAYKNSSLAFAHMAYACNVFFSFSHSKTPAYLQLEGNLGVSGAAMEWSLLPGDIYSTRY